MTPHLKACLLGSPKFWLNDNIILLPLTRKTISLLAYLLLHPHNIHSREKLATLFWGDFSDQQARHSLRTALASLRKELRSDLFITNRETVQINPDVSVWVDALQFEKDAISAAKGETKDLQDAIELYSGDLLTDFYDDWILRKRDHYCNLYLDLLLRMTQLLRSQSEYGLAIEYAQRVLNIDPSNERAHQHLIFCYLANGDRSAAVSQYENCRRVLQEELAVEPSPETTALFQWIKQAPVKSIEARITNLPIPLTSFIGRTREMARVKYMLSQERLVTLTGAGGSGKTRLAIQVASDLVDSFRDGVWWVDFAPLMDAALVPQTVAKVIGVQEGQNEPISKTLVDHLSTRNMLLVLDNCEHLVDEISRLTITLLSICANLKILATSRETLDIPGESILRVPSLSFPITRQLLPGEKLEDYESVRLLLERSAVIGVDLAQTQENVSALAQICRRLDGIPLAIELAAARLNVLTIDQIAARLDDRFSLLTTGSRITLPRHQTLRAVIDWSYDFLSQTEQVFLCRLAVFVGGWTLDAAEAVCAEVVPAHEIMDLLASLVNKSLVQAVEEEGSQARYRMLETMRQYGLERLHKAGQVEAARHYHSLYFAELAEKAEQGLRGTGMHMWYERLEAEHDNFRSALEWSLAHETPAFCLRFAGALGIFWHRGYLHEGLTYLDRVLDQGIDAPPYLRVKAIASASWLARDLGNYEKATSLYDESLKILHVLGDKFGLADALIQGGLLAVYKNDPQTATDCFTESLALSEEVDYRWGRARALVNLAHTALFNLQWNEQARVRGEESLQLFKEMGDATEQAHALIILGPGAHYEGDDQRGSELIEQAIPICRHAGDRRQLAWATSALAVMIHWQGKNDEALSVAKEGLRLAMDLGEKSITVFVSLLLAVLAKDKGKIKQALHLLGSAITLGESFGYRLTPFQWDIINQDIDEMRATLGDVAFHQAWGEGVVMPFKVAIQDVLQDKSPFTSLSKK